MACQSCRRQMHHYSRVVCQRISLALHPPGTSLASPEMAFEIWKEPKVIVASVLLLVIPRTVYEKDQVAGRPLAVFWVGSDIDLWET